MGTDLYGLVSPAVLCFRELLDPLALLESRKGSLFFFCSYAQKEAWFSYLDFMKVLLEFSFRWDKSYPTYGTMKYT